MKYAIVLAALVSVSCAVQAKDKPKANAAPAKQTCKFSEGDDFSASGEYLWADSCDLYGTVEAVNKDCTKAKVSVSKVTQAFGMRVNAKCRIGGAEGGAGDTIWVPIQN